jgi:hypothetical protein
MTNTYTWNFPQLEVYPTYATQTDVVFTVHWILVGSNDSIPPVTVQLYGTQAVTYEAGAPFTPYSELTQPQVESWVLGAMGPDMVANYYNNINIQIADIINPPSQNLPPPW